MKGSRKLTGVIANLPKEIRNQVNGMLQDGHTYPEIIDHLKIQGYPATESNLSNWFTGGHTLWLAEQTRLEDMREKREFALQIVRENEGSKIHEAGMALASSQIYEVLNDFDLGSLKTLLADKPENFPAVVNALSKLSKTGLEFDKYKDLVTESRRKIEAELGKVKNGGLTPEAISKMQEALNLL